jgi:hypothetical protein
MWVNVRTILLSVIDVQNPAKVESFEVMNVLLPPPGGRLHD